MCMLYMHARLLPSNQLSQTTSNSPNSPLPYQSLATTTTTLLVKACYSYSPYPAACCLLFWG